MSQPSSPLDLEAVQRLIQQAAENERGYLRFVQDQAANDRAYFRHVFNGTAFFLGLLIAASAAGAVFFGFRTVSELRQEMRTITQEELRKTEKEVQDQIKAAFEEPHIHELVVQVAKEVTARESSKLIKQAVDAKVAQEVNPRVELLDRNLTALGERADMGMKMRIGLRSGLTDLTARARSADSDVERRRAGELLARITADYDSVWTDGFQQDLGGNITMALMNIKAAPKDPKKPVPAFINVIRSSRRLDAIALAFVALRKATGQPFPMFDFAAVERWCKEKAPACE